MRRTAVAILALAATAASASAVTIQFDYSYDTSNFFNTQAKRDLLTQAATTFTPFTDQLASVQSEPSSYGAQYMNRWTATFSNPATGSQATVPNLVVPQNTLIVYVGGRVLSGTTLGVGGPGGASYNYYDAGWSGTIGARGQAGANATPKTDFGPWGGSIVFDADANWWFNSSITGIGGTQSDFLSVAIHELAHVLGMGTGGSWDTLTPGSTFNGTTANSLYGSNVPLDGGGGHWLDGTSSSLPGSVGPQETAMDPSITTGTRKLFTVLDYAGMKDIGWQVPDQLISVPEPTSVAVVLLGATTMLARRRRRA